MAENNSQQDRRADWSLAESVLNSEKLPTCELRNGVGPCERQLVPAEHSSVPVALTIPAPTSDESQGILVQWKAKQLGRKAALEAVAAQYESKLEILKHTLTEAVHVQKTRVDVAAKEYLERLDAKHLELLAQFGMRNAATRWKAVTDLTDMAVVQVRQVQGKEWPEPLVKDTISKIFALRERVAGEIMKELGIEHSHD